MNQSNHSFINGIVYAVFLVLLGAVLVPDAVYAKTFTPVYIDMKYPVEGEKELGLDIPAGVKNFETTLYLDRGNGEGWKETTLTDGGEEEEGGFVSGYWNYKLAVRFYLNHKNESDGGWDKPSAYGWGVHFKSDLGYEKKIDAEDVVIQEVIQSGEVAGYNISFNIVFKALTKLQLFWLKCPSILSFTEGDLADYGFESLSNYYDVTGTIKWFAESSPTKILGVNDKLVGGQYYDILVPIKINDTAIFDGSKGIDIYIDGYDDNIHPTYYLPDCEYVHSERTYYARLEVPVVRKIDSIGIDGIQMPKAGGKPQTKGVLLKCLSENPLHPIDMEMEGDVKWEGTFADDGSFLPDEHYSLTINYNIRYSPVFYSSSAATKLKYNLNAGIVEKSSNRESTDYKWTVKIGLDCPKKKNTITFDSNGGSGSMAKVTVEEGSQYTLPKCTFTAPAGKEFDKWNKGVVGTTITVNSDVTLIAQWKEKKTDQTIKKDQKQMEILKVEAADKNSIKNLEKKILSRKSNSDLKKSTFKPLKVKAAATTRSSIKVSWSRVNDAAGYIVYGNLSGKTHKMKRLTSTSKTRLTVKKIGKNKLKKGKYYKFIVLAYKTKDGYKKCLATSNVVHACTTGGSVTNVKRIKPKTTKKTLKKGKTWTIKASTVKNDNKKKLKKCIGLRFVSSDKSVATVSSKGRVKAKKTGKATIYVYAQNGVYASVSITVKAK